MDAAREQVLSINGPAEAYGVQDGHDHQERPCDAPAVSSGITGTMPKITTPPSQTRYGNLSSEVTAVLYR
ncbi:hypothetical protein ACFQZ4_53875 [Catellatospora coxensis]|uniref:Uncharacterized protein n=1 Tax=Catellatospora coxensis TaxID=310354 RepID=A0A8J3KMT6_9ACTN|nr:hypothetical protein Cco03nite_25620 [Catellatospora coxensis]